MKVWLLWVVSCSDALIKYVCSTEEKARKRFEDVKREIIKDWEERYNYELCKEDDPKMTYEYWQALYGRSKDKHISVLKRMTFDDLEPGKQTVHDKPWWEAWEVE